MIKSVRDAALKKSNITVRDVIYLHLNEEEDFIVSSGIEFYEFMNSLGDKVTNILLLKHRFEAGYFHMHSLFEYVPKEIQTVLIEDDVYGYGDFCWIDFNNEENLDDLSELEISQLLYLGHKKMHLQRPFYKLLNNSFVYLAHDDGHRNKMYFKNLKDLDILLRNCIPNKLSNLKVEKSFLGLRKQKEYPFIQPEIFPQLKNAMLEGIVISLKDLVQTRTKIEVPIVVIGDYINMDDMMEDYEQLDKEAWDYKLVLDKRTRVWSLHLV